MPAPNSAAVPEEPMQFIHEWPASRVVFGPGRIAAVAAEVARHGDRVVVINDRVAGAPADRITAELGSSAVLRVPEVVQHVPAGTVAAAVSAVRSARAEVIVCVGGGSATGLAKGIARELALPVVAVPTTYAGSEMTSIWGLTENGLKTTGRAEIVRPRTVVYDPELTLGLPTAISLTSGINAIAHCVEALYAADSSPLGRLTAAEGIRSMSGALPVLLAEPRNLEARGLALRGAWLSGWALEVSSTGLHHKLCHVLGGLFDLPHSPLHTVLLPYVVTHLAPAAPDRTRLLLDSLGLPGSTIDAGGLIWDLHRKLGVPASLADIGLRMTDLDLAITRSVAALAGGPFPPRPASPGDLEHLLRTAVTGDRPVTG
ncbi:maleylacetate reductase [Amycolatopsis sp. NPDC005232]|uniref:maleylacetate reductase n=1 Tax=Amycolatopsis sp. NPDC005232 TaxID=3157027 RepID=UPI0033BF0592